MSNGSMCRCSTPNAPFPRSSTTFVSPARTRYPEAAECGPAPLPEHPRTISSTRAPYGPDLPERTGPGDPLRSRIEHDPSRVSSDGGRRSGTATVGDHREARGEDAPDRAAEVCLPGDAGVAGQHAEQQAAVDQEQHDR